MFLHPVDALSNIPSINHALDLFLSSHILESEDYKCHYCNQHRRKQAFQVLVNGFRLACYVVLTFHPSGVGFIFIKGMAEMDITEVERHAVLAFAEIMFGKALLKSLACFIKESYVTFYLVIHYDLL